MSCVLDIRHLSVASTQGKQSSLLVDDLSFSISKGRCLGILGESGSGKSMTCKAIMGLLDRNFKVTGEALFNESNLLTQSSEEMRKLRGSKISMVMQNPMTSFDPLYRIDYQMAETFAEHTAMTKEAIREKSIDTLKLMMIKNPEEVLKKYPHQLSGGMLQRIMIGLAMALEPQLLIADEPTTAIDTISQYHIMEEFVRIKKENQLTMIFISHDLGVLSKIADDVIVMHHAKAVEKGALNTVFKSPKNAYTHALINERLTIMKQFNKAIEGKGRDAVC